VLSVVAELHCIGLCCCGNCYSACEKDSNAKYDYRK
jgi:hypothetical protein